MLRLASFLFQSPAIKCFHSNNSDNEYTPSILPFLFYITPHSPFFYPHMSSQFVTDVYSGFDDYEHAYDSQHLANDVYFQEAIVRSSHGRRPTSRMLSRSMRLATSVRVDTSIHRPLTAVKGIGYSSYHNKIEAEEAKAARENNEDNIDGRIKEGESKAMELVKESVILRSQGNLKGALEKAKEAGRRERSIVKLRDDNNRSESINIDLTFCILFNLAQMYEGNDLTTEAINSYTVITKNKTFVNGGRLKVNIGNIHFKRKEYNKAIKMYRMALDQIPAVQKTLRMAIMKNIGLTFIKMGRYEEAAYAFEQGSEERTHPSIAFYSLLSMYCLEDNEKMRDSFIKLLEIHLPSHDVSKEKDGLLSQITMGDSLTHFIRAIRLKTERFVLSAARVIGMGMNEEPTSGHEWCIDMIKQSSFAYMASELEMSKAVYLMREGRIKEAETALSLFSNAPPKMASSALANRSILEWMKGNGGEALNHINSSLLLDRYNTTAHVMEGIIAFQNEDIAKAILCMQEALQNDALCMQAIYNLGLIYKKAQNLESALDYFYKLNNMLRNNVQVLCQLASIYEYMEDSGQAIELYSQANSLAPTDPSILTKLSNIYESEQDKTQAFQCLYDSYRYLPSDMKTVEWIAAYYLDAQFAEKAVTYFEKAALMQPNEIKWHMMIASCTRRSGNYHKAFQLYKAIHNKFPSHLPCLKFLVRIATDLGMSEANEYASRLQKAERVNQLRQQRESDSAHGKSGSAASVHSLPIPLNSTDLSYTDTVGRVERPKTGLRKEGSTREDSFDDLDDSFLPM
uniref:Osm-5 n=1 Tax=Pristionchus pacificus TaxID=54126 RepID=A0A2A6BTZ3_PRIPA|eukprot:PDM69399.1 osm-5 [Pristionchus pacificus]